MPDEIESYSEKVKRYDRTMKAHAFVSASIRLCTDAMRLDPSVAQMLEPAVGKLMSAKAQLSRNLKAMGQV